MNTDRAVPNEAQRKLLVLAAKAAGINTNWSIMRGFNVCDGTARTWNPFEDDGDAMELASRLLMSFRLGDDGVRVWVGDYASEDLDKDVYPAFRRAIVSVAAQIGQDGA